MSTLWDAARGAAVDMRARIGRGVSAQGFYAQRLRFRDLVFDVGANIGDHTRAMLKRGARVVAIEPQPDIARRLERDFPAATVLRLGVSNRPGRATLMTSPNDHIATLNPAWPERFRETLDSSGDWNGEETIQLTTLDDLIAEFGCPAFVKIDTEGLDDKVLAGLSQPIEQLLFEVLSGLPDVAIRSFERLAALGSYEYRVMECESWVFGPPVSAAAILADLPPWGDVYARRIHGSIRP
jgi:FkbM family methyltransferase